MIRICCDCKKVLGEKEPLEDKRITHGYCPECLERTMKEIEEVDAEFDDLEWNRSQRFDERVQP